MGVVFIISTHLGRSHSYTLYTQQQAFPCKRTWVSEFPGAATFASSAPGLGSPSCSIQLGYGPMTTTLGTLAWRQEGCEYGWTVTTLVLLAVGSVTVVSADVMAQRLQSLFRWTGTLCVLNYSAFLCFLGGYTCLADIPPSLGMWRPYIILLSILHIVTTIPKYVIGFTIKGYHVTCIKIQFTLPLWLPVQYSNQLSQTSAQVKGCEGGG